MNTGRLVTFDEISSLYWLDFHEIINIVDHRSRSKQLKAKTEEWRTDENSITSTNAVKWHYTIRYRKSESSFTILAQFNQEVSGRCFVSHRDGVAHSPPLHIYTESFFRSYCKELQIQPNRAQENFFGEDNLKGTEKIDSEVIHFVSNDGIQVGRRVDQYSIIFDHFYRENIPKRSRGFLGSLFR